MRKWLLVVMSILCVGIGLGFFGKSPTLVEVKDDKKPFRWGKINVFHKVSPLLGQQKSDGICFLKIQESLPENSEIFRINCFCDAILIEDWRLLDPLEKIGIKIPIFISFGPIDRWEKVMYSPQNEMFGHQLSTNSKALFEKCVRIWGEKVIGSELESIFTKIYRNGLWGRNERGEGFSGTGSLPENARPFMDFLEGFMTENQIQSVVEIGCGDWTMQRHIDWKDVDYTGIDWVKYILNRNQSMFASDRIHFIHGDALKMELPKADLIICKEVFQHLSNRDTKKLLSKCKTYKHCLFVDDFDPMIRGDRDVPSGSYMPISVNNPPFNLNGQKVMDYESFGIQKRVIYFQGE